MASWGWYNRDPPAPKAPTGWNVPLPHAAHVVLLSFLPLPQLFWLLLCPAFVYKLLEIESLLHHGTCSAPRTAPRSVEALLLWFVFGTVFHCTLCPACTSYPKPTFKDPSEGALTGPYHDARSSTEPKWLQQWFVLINIWINESIICNSLSSFNEPLEISKSQISISWFDFARMAKCCLWLESSVDYSIFLSIMSASCSSTKSTRLCLKFSEKQTNKHEKIPVIFFSGAHRSSCRHPWW